MESKHYKVHSTAYPRYEYSVRNGISIYKRCNIMLKNIGFDQSSKLNLPLNEDPQIIVACRKGRTHIVDKADIELKKIYVVQKLKKNNYNDFKTLIHDNKLDNTSPTIIVIELNKIARHTVREYENWKHNIIIVVDGDDFKPSNTDEVRITNKRNIGAEICLMLERIVFRNMLPLKGMLQGLLATANYQLLTCIVKRNVLNVIHTVLKKEKSFVGWLNEIDDRLYLNRSAKTQSLINEKNFGKYLVKVGHRVVFRNSINTKYIVSFKERQLVNRKVVQESNNDKGYEVMNEDCKLQVKTKKSYGYITVPRIDEQLLMQRLDENKNDIKASLSHTTDKYGEKLKHERDDCKLEVVEYFEENDCMYELVGKLADRVGRVVEQEVITEFERMPIEFRSLLNIQIENENIRDEVADKLFHLFVCTIDTKLDNDDLADEMLLCKLRYRSSVLLERVCDIVSELKILETIDHHIKMIKFESNRTINSLLGELMGLFRRSKIPYYERPNHGKFKLLSEKVAQTLLEDVQEVKGCGYSYDKLHVFVQEIRDKDKKETVESEIKKVLFRNNISDYVVRSSNIFVTQFRHIGAQIRVGRSGTLGGFALMGAEKHVCALFSRHLVNGAQDVHFKANADKEIIIGSIVKIDNNIVTIDDEQENKSGVDYVDIATATIRDSVKSDCNTFFKDSLRRPMLSQICNFTEDDMNYLLGLKVHICGASTELGMGIIHIPEFYVEGNRKLVLIEDIEDEDGTFSRFSREGDSGAVVCADDPDGEYVLVISMLIGCRNYEEISIGEQSKGNKGEYLSFRMTDGLDRLKRETQQEFKLCNEY